MVPDGKSSPTETATHAPSLGLLLLASPPCRSAGRCLPSAFIRSRHGVPRSSRLMRLVPFPVVMPVAPHPVAAAMLASPPGAPKEELTHSLLLASFPAVASLGLPAGVSFALSYQLIFLSCMLVSPSLAEQGKPAKGDRESLIFRNALFSIGAAALIVCMEALARVPVGTPLGAFCSLSCVILGGLAGIELLEVDSGEEPTDLLLQQKKEARKLRRSWDSRLSWRARKRAALKE